MMPPHLKRRVKHTEGHFGLGDLVAAGTKAFGIEPCGTCEERRKAFNRVRLKRAPTRA